MCKDYSDEELESLYRALGDQHDTGLEIGGIKLKMSGVAMQQIAEMYPDDTAREAFLRQFLEKVVAEKKVREGEQLTPRDAKALEYGTYDPYKNMRRHVLNAARAIERAYRLDPRHRRRLTNMLAFPARCFCSTCGRRRATKRRRCPKCRCKKYVIGVLLPHATPMYGLAEE